jgi:hypothetical protein
MPKDNIMPNFDTQLFSEVAEVLAKLDPASQTTAQVSGWISFANHRRIVAIIQNGLIASTGTLDAKLQMAKTSGGGSAADIPGKAITQLADTVDNKLIMIEIKSDEIPETYTHIQLSVTPATAASLVSFVVLGLEPRFSPVPLTNVHQVVV